MRRIIKLGFVISRQSSIFSLPLLNRIRNFFYAKHLNTTDINVDDFVRIGPAHRTDNMEISIGSGLRVGRNSELDSSGGLHLGDRVTISEGSKIYTHDHIIDNGTVDWRKNGIKTNKLYIGDDAWIGAGAIILPTTGSIGEGPVIASGAVVRSPVEAMMIVAGNPAKQIRQRKFKSDV